MDTVLPAVCIAEWPAGNDLAGYRLMEKAYKAGKVRAIGLSNFTAEQVHEIFVKRLDRW